MIALLRSKRVVKRSELTFRGRRSRKPDKHCRKFARL